MTGISPPSGQPPLSVTVNGSGFTGATAVSFGPHPGSNPLVAANGTALTVGLPAGTGTVDVTVTTPAGTSQPVAAGQFSYLR